MADDDRATKLAAWASAGERLRAADPRRFDAMLELAERIACIHEDPMSVPVRRTREISESD